MFVSKVLADMFPKRKRQGNVLGKVPNMQKEMEVVSLLLFRSSELYLLFSKYTIMFWLFLYTNMSHWGSHRLPRYYSTRYLCCPASIWVRRLCCPASIWARHLYCQAFIWDRRLCCSAFAWTRRLCCPAFT